MQRVGFKKGYRDILHCIFRGIGKQKYISIFRGMCTTCIQRETGNMAACFSLHGVVLFDKGEIGCAFNLRVLRLYHPDQLKPLSAYIPVANELLPIHSMNARTAHAGRHNEGNAETAQLRAHGSKGDWQPLAAPFSRPCSFSRVRSRRFLLIVHESPCPSPRHRTDTRSPRRTLHIGAYLSSSGRRNTRSSIFGAFIVTRFF